MRSKKFVVYAVLFALVTVFSCKDDTVYNHKEADNNHDKVAALKIHYKPSTVYYLGEATESNTRVSPEWGLNEEMIVKNVHVFQYEVGSDAIVAYDYVEVTDSDDDIFVKLGGDEGATRYDIYFLVNWGPAISKIANHSSGDDDYTETELKGLTRSALTGSTFCKNITPTMDTGVPSKGMSGDVAVKSMPFDVSVELHRILARVDVQVVLGDAMKFAFDFYSLTMESVAGVYVPYNQTSSGTYPDLSSSTIINEVEPINKISNSFPYFYDQVVYTFFIPENARGTISNTDPINKNNSSPTNSSYIKVQGYFDFPGETYSDQDLKCSFYPGANDYNDFNIYRNMQYKVKLGLTGASSTTDARVSLIDDLQKPTSYTTDKLCKLAYTGQPVYLNVRSLAASNEEIRANVIWRDNPNLKINFRVFDTKVFKVIPEGGDGNAVIEIINNNTGQRLRQYHIWVVDKEVKVFDTSHDVMFLNLGATADVNPASENVESKGLLYQWGRPYPMPGKKNYDSNNPGKGSLCMIVYKGNEYDDRLILKEYTLLGDDNTFANYMATQSSYFSDYFISATAVLAGIDGETWSNDPCPEGWKIPNFEEAKATLEGLEMQSGSSYFKYGDYYFPVNSNYYNRNFGYVSTGTNNSYYWMSDTKSAFNFKSQTAKEILNAPCGYPVRCIRDDFVVKTDP